MAGPTRLSRRAVQPLGLECVSITPWGKQHEEVDTSYTDFGICLWDAQVLLSFFAILSDQVCTDGDFADKMAEQFMDESTELL